MNWSSLLSSGGGGGSSAAPVSSSATSGVSFGSSGDNTPFYLIGAGLVAVAFLVILVLIRK